MMSTSPGYARTSSPRAVSGRPIFAPPKLLERPPEPPGLTLGRLPSKIDGTVEAMSELHFRARNILYAAITEFISTGEPVGSRTLAKKYGLDLSPASIRNVLSDLEESGFLHQPHTSAGRIPTDKAFRLFIDTLMQVRSLAPDERERIDQRFHALVPGADFTRESGRPLSELTGTAVIV